MRILITNLLSLLIILIPFGLVAGPAIPDIVVSVSSTIFIFFLLINKKIDYFNNKIFIYFILFCFYLLTLSFFSIDPNLSFESSLFYFRFGVFTLLFLYILENDKKFLSKLFFSLLILFVLLFFDSMIQFIYKKNLLGFPVFKNEYRITSFFNDELKLGSFISRFLPIIIGLSYLIFLNKLKKYTEIFCFPFLFLSFIIIYLTGERVSLFYFFIFLFSYFLLFKFNNHFIETNKIKLFFLSIIIFCLVIFSNEDIFNRIIKYTLFQFFEGNRLHIFSVQHEAIYFTSYKILLDNPLFGIGPKIFRVLCSFGDYPTYSMLDSSINGCQTHPHNTYIQLLVETGLIGFILVLMLFVYISLKIIFHFYQVIRFKKYIYDNLQISILILMFINLFPFVPNGNFFNNWLSIVYYFPIALMIFVLRKSKPYQ